MEPLPALLDLATASLSCADVDALVKACAARVGGQLEARAVLVWMLSEAGEELVCRARWSEAGAGFTPVSEPVSEGMLVAALEEEHAVGLAPDEVEPERLTHLQANDRPRVKTALYAALPGPGGAAGVVELLNKRLGEFSAEDGAWLEEALRIVGRALGTLRGIEKDRGEHLGTIERLTQLYDLSRVFNSSLELEALLPHIAERIADLLGAGACNVYLADAESGELSFAQQAGADPTTSEDARIPKGEGLLGLVAKRGEAKLVAAAEEEPLLAERGKPSGEFEIETLMAAPLMKDEEVLGVVELVNKDDGTPFDDDDLFFLTSIAEQAAIALKNANLLAAERKVRELDALLAISKEITSTLNLDKVLLTVVNQASAVLPFERCAIGLFDRGRFELAAVSGLEAVPKTPEMDSLRKALEWCSTQEGAVVVNRGEDGWKAEPEPARDVLGPHLEQAGYQGFYALPLSDEQGTLGVLGFESEEPESLTEDKADLLSILGSQTTVAVRNALLYQQVPLINLMRPILERKARLQAMPRARVRQLAQRAAAVAVALVVIPWPLRVGTSAQVVPAERRAVAAEMRGVIRHVLVREGDSVAAGAVLAEQEAGDDRVALERAEADLALARHQLGDAGGRGDLAAAGQAQLRLEIAQAEADLYRGKVEKARLRAPRAGIVITPKVEERVGALLERGETFCELVASDRLAVAMNVPETSLDLVQPGGRVSVKLNTLPTSTFAGSVERVGAQAVSFEGAQYFVVRGGFANDGGRARPGMVGRAKIVASGGWWEGHGLYPVGYVMLRDPVRWFWRKVWAWLP